MDVKHLPDNGEADVWLETGRFKDNWFPSTEDAAINLATGRGGRQA